MFGASMKTIQHNDFDHDCDQECGLLLEDGSTRCTGFQQDCLDANAPDEPAYHLIEQPEGYDDMALCEACYLKYSNTDEG